MVSLGLKQCGPLRTSQLRAAPHSSPHRPALCCTACPSAYLVVPTQAGAG